MEGCLLWLPNRRIRLLRVGCYREVWSLHADKPGLLWSVEFLNTLTVFLILSLFCVIWFNWPCILWSWALTDPLSPDCHFHPEWTIKLSANLKNLKACGPFCSLTIALLPCLIYSALSVLWPTQLITILNWTMPTWNGNLLGFYVLRYFDQKPWARAQCTNSCIHKQNR